MQQKIEHGKNSPSSQCMSDKNDQKLLEHVQSSSRTDTNRLSLEQIGHSSEIELSTKREIIESLPTSGSTSSSNSKNVSEKTCKNKMKMKMKVEKRPHSNNYLLKPTSSRHSLFEQNEQNSICLPLHSSKEYVMYHDQVSTKQHSQYIPKLFSSFGNKLKNKNYLKNSRLYSRIERERERELLNLNSMGSANEENKDGIESIYSRDSLHDLRHTTFSNDFNDIKLQYKPNSEHLLSQRKYAEKVASHSSTNFKYRTELDITVKNLIFFRHPRFNEEEISQGRLLEVYREYMDCMDSLTKLAINLMQEFYQHAKYKEKSSNISISESCNSEKIDRGIRSLSNVAGTIDTITSQQQELKCLENLLVEQWQGLVALREGNESQFTVAKINSQQLDLSQEVKLLLEKKKKDGESKVLGTAKNLHYRVTLAYLAHMNITEVLPWNISRNKSDCEIYWNDKLEGRKDTIQKFMSKCAHNQSKEIVCYKLVQKKLIHKNTRNNGKRIFERYFVRLLLNGNIVGKSKPVNLDPSLSSVIIEQKFRCRVIKKPKTIQIEIGKKDILLNLQHWRSFRTVTIPIETWATEEKSRRKEFHNNTTWYSFKNTAASAVKNTENQSNLTKGAVSVSFHWNKYTSNCAKESDFLMITPNGEKNISSEVWSLSRERKNGVSEFNSSKLIDKTNFSVFRKSVEFNTKKQSLFSTEEQKSRDSCLGFRFGASLASIQNIREPVRLKLLRLRNHNKTIASPIPLEETDIIFDESYQSILHEKKISIGKELESTQKEVVSGPETSNISVVKVDNITLDPQAETVKESLLHSDFVKEVSYFQFEEESNIMFNFFKSILPSKKRSLKPHVKRRQADSTDKRLQSVLITIVGATNLPQRNLLNVGGERVDVSPKASNFYYARESSKTNINLTSNTTASDKNVLNSYVQIKLGQITVNSKSMQGNSPLWKQTIEVPVISDKDQNIKIRLFDEIFMDLRDIGGYYRDENTTHKESRYLGQCDIPIRTIYKHGRMEGIFQLITPIVHLGYTKKQDTDDEKYRSTGLFSNAEKSQVKESTSFIVDTPLSLDLSRLEQNATKSNSYIKLIVASNPPLQSQDKNKLKVIMKESRNLVEFGKKWEKRLKRFNKPYTAKRHYDIFVDDKNGYGWFICRYMKSQNPPPGCDSASKCAHFVSLISRSREAAFASVDDTWYTHQQFLNDHIGNNKERAILLASYFMWLSDKDEDSSDTDVFLVLGTGLPEGKTVYVMKRLKSTNEVTMWDATRGKSFSLDDIQSPLQTIHSIVTPKNVFGNVQSVTKPSQTDLNLRNRKSWIPFYSNWYPPPVKTLPSVQESNLNYIKPDEQFAYELQEKLIDTLKLSIRTWRRGSTSIRVDVSNKLRTILDILELSKYEGKSVSQMDAMKRINARSKGRKVFGFPMHFTNVNIPYIIEKVRETSIHAVKHPDTEFALASRVFPYHSNIASIWIFICYLSPL